MGFVFIGSYFAPVVMFMFNYLLLPYVIIKLTFYENNQKISQREFSIVNKTYLYMVFNTIILPGLEFTSLVSYIYMLAAVKNDVTSEIDDQIISFRIFDSIDFFLRFMIQLIFLSISI